jgi:hypothetical protein
LALEQINLTIASEEQDMLDRDKISLYAFSDTPPTNDSLLIKLNPECVSHSGDINKVTRLFKLACLGYKHSSISYRGTMVGKAEMLRVKKFIAG